MQFRLLCGCAKAEKPPLSFTGHEDHLSMFFGRTLLVTVSLARTGTGRGVVGNGLNNSLWSSCVVDAGFVSTMILGAEADCLVLDDLGLLLGE